MLLLHGQVCPSFQFIFSHPFSAGKETLQALEHERERRLLHKRLSEIARRHGSLYKHTHSGAPEPPPKQAFYKAESHRQIDEGNAILARKLLSISARRSLSPAKPITHLTQPQSISESTVSSTSHATKHSRPTKLQMYQYVERTLENRALSKKLNELAHRKPNF